MTDAHPSPTEDGTGGGVGVDSFTAPSNAERVADELRAAFETRREAEEAVADPGIEVVETVTDAYERAMALLDRYEDRATGTGDFGAFVEFQQKFLEVVESVADDAPAADAFDAANETVDRRRLSEKHFESARDALSPAADIAGLLEERVTARERHRTATRDAEQCLSNLNERIAELRRLERLGDADLDAPVERLREPIRAYNEAVGEAFETFKRDGSARDVLSFVATAAGYPLVDYDAPPADLREYVGSADVGGDPIPELLEYADYSNSKLSHFVADPQELKARVAVNRTYLTRLDGGPLTVSWPPPSAERLRFFIPELVSVVSRFAPDDVVARCRKLRYLAEAPDYDRLQTAAEARESLTDAERRRLQRGEVETALDAFDEHRDRLSDVLARYGYESGARLVPSESYSSESQSSDS
ncbi:DUF7118 family protein [Haloprofundus salilacus]|uniref:DUF7118 family protein n=1 Tax=Haloprofundus salilacus TaxID=2876190 RepID=UPI001CCC77AD|nr:hypothetical protein [Haloprofundus salilacus]